MRGILPATLLTALAACSEAPPPPRPAETEVPADLRPAPAPAAPQADTGGTPMKDRVAVLGLLNKRNNISQDLTMKPGETRRIGDVIVALKACERTAPWEMPQETGAFAQVFVQQGRQQQGFAKVFSGWLFRESPSLNVVEHPVYDVWVKDCRMSFPGEEAAAGGAAAPSGSPRAPASPQPSPSPAPATSPSPASAPETSEPTA